MKYIRLIIVSAALSLAVSCSLNEEPRGKLFPESYYNNNAELELTVTKIYQQNARIVAKDHESLWGCLQGADTETCFGGNRQDMISFDVFNGDPAEAFAYEGWGEGFKTIRICNALIENYQRATEATEEQRNRAAAQAYFARAFTYFYLVRVFGELPYVVSSNPPLDLKKSKPAKICYLIVEDLTFAEQHLPEKWSDYRSISGYTKGAAKALLSSVYLWMGGYPVKHPEAYAKAAAKAKEVIEKEAAWGYKLVDLDQLWEPTLTNAEIVLGFYYNKDGNGTMRSPNSCRPVDWGGWDLFVPELKFFYEYPECKRKEATFITEFPMNTGNVKPWNELFNKHPYYKKYLHMEGYDPQRPWWSPDWQSSRTLQIIRYAEVLLNYAEAQVRSAGSPDALAYDCMDRIRERAGMNKLERGLNGAAFASAVVQERAWEFCGGDFCHRWFDLVRLEMVEESVKGRITVADKNGAKDHALVNQPTKKHYFTVTPSLELLKNPNLAFTEE